MTSKITAMQQDFYNQTFFSIQNEVQIDLIISVLK